jgi:outer membrane protein assembly factor BamB
MYRVGWDDKANICVNVYEQSLELENHKMIDTTKALAVTINNSPTIAFEPTFITMTSDGHAMVSTNDAWYIFNVETGELVRRQRPLANTYLLRNKVERRLQYLAVHSDGTIFEAGNDRAAWNRYPTADHLIQLDLEDDVVVDVGVLKRKS